MDDTVRSLIRFVVRGFYSKSCVLILDAVLLHSVLSEDDLNYLLGIQRKELRSLCNKLVDDRLLANHIQKEENAQLRLTTRTYYYIHITEAIDAIKWKVHSVVSRIKEEMTKYGNPQGYVCPRCSRQYSQIDAISLLSDDKSSFICDTCGGVLVEDDSNKQASIRQARLEKLMEQIDPIITYLKRIDDSHVEDNTFESALFKSVPAQSSTSASYALSNHIMSTNRNSLALSAGMDNSKSQATLHVSITANDENYEKEQQAREERRQKLQQNVLPSWHSSGSVTNGSIGKLDKDEPDSETETKPIVKSEFTDDGESFNNANSLVDVSTMAKSDGTEASNSSELKEKEAQDALAAYYADLAKREEEEDDDDNEDEDEDDEDMFEDLEI